MTTVSIKRGEATILTLDIDEAAIYTKKLMGEHRIVLPYKAGSPLNLQIGDYITYNGENFTLNRVPDCEKKDSRTYEYRMEFEGYIYNLAKKIYISSDGLAEFSLNGTATDFLNLLITNINAIDGTWSLGTVDTTEYKTLTFKNETCRAALSHIAEEFKLEFDVTGRVITMKASVGGNTAYSFSYGKNNGLYSIKRQQVNDQNIVTKVYGFGGTQNIPASYRNRAKRLIFASRYLEKNVSLYGTIEAQYTDENIYPKLTDDIGVVTSVNMSFPGGTYDPYTSYIEASNINFDINAYLIAGVVAKIVFKTGPLAGREHEIWKWDNTNKRIYFNQYLDPDGYATPVSGTIPAIGNTFDLLGISLPQSYIDTAENALQAATQAYLDANCIPQIIYSLDIDEKYARSINLSVKPGDKVTIVDSSFGVNGLIRISGIEWPLVNEYRVKCTVSDKVPYTQQERLIKAVMTTRQTDAISTLVTEESVRRTSLRMSQYRDAIFDPDGYFNATRIKPLSIETLYLSVGAKSTDFKLSGVTIQPNYLGNKARIAVSSGTLVHNQVNNSGNYTWTIGSGIDQSGLVDDTTYYLYAKCSTSAQTGEWILDTVKRTWDYEAGYYYFWVGILFPVSGGVRDYDFTNGMTYINGRTITTGKIQSADTYNYLDLEGNKFRIGDSGTSSMDWNVTAANTLTIRGALFVSGGTTFPAMVYRGSYDAGTIYYMGDEVTYDSKLWVYVNSTPASGQTPADNAYWDLLGGGGVTNHAALSNLSYAAAGHTGFAPADSPALTTYVTLTHASNPYIRLIKTAATARTYDIKINNDDFYLNDVTSSLTSIFVEGGTGKVGIGGVTSVLTPLHIVTGGSGGVPTGTTPSFGILITGSGTNGSLNMGMDATGTFYSWIQSRDKTSATYYALQINRAGGDVQTIASGNSLYIGDVTNTSTNNMAGFRFYPTGGNLYVDIKTYTNQAAFFRCGHGTELGDVRTWLHLTTSTGDIGSSNFTSGYAGTGWRMTQTTPTLTVDNLIVRNKIWSYEVEINKITSIGGSVLLSLCNAKIINVVNLTDPAYRLYIDEDGGNRQFGFIVDDFVKGRQFNGRDVRSFHGRVTAIHHSNTYGAAYIDIIRSAGYDAPVTGLDIFHAGSSSNSSRRSLIYFTASDTNNPYIDMLAGVDSADWSGKTKVRIGNLAGITDSEFGGALSGYGLYANNVYLKGKLVVANGMTVESLALGYNYGKMLYRDPTFATGSNSTTVYNELGNGTVTVTRTASGADSPNYGQSGYDLVIKYTAGGGGASPGYGGFYFGTQTRANAVFVARIVAKIPTGRYIVWHSNGAGNEAMQRWLTPVEGTGRYEEYICYLKCGYTGSLSTTMFFAVHGGADTTFSWHVSFATVYDLTASDVPINDARVQTVIDGGLITTGSIQVGASGTIKAGMDGSGTADSSIRFWAGKTYANRATAAFRVTQGGAMTATSGNIGGFSIGTNYLTAGTQGTAGWGGMATDGLIAATYFNFYALSHQSGNLTLTSQYFHVSCDCASEQTLTLPATMPGSGTGSMMIISHKYGTGLGVGKYHVNGNGRSILYNGNPVSSFDVDEGYAYLLSYDPRGGTNPSGLWYVIGGKGGITGDGVAKITVSTTTPSNPATGDLWVDTN